MAQQVVGILIILVLFSIASAFFGSSDLGLVLASRNAPVWHDASFYFSAAFVLVAIGISLTSGSNLTLAADRIAFAAGKARSGRPKQLLMGISVQFGLSSILAALMAMRVPCDIVSLIRCFANTIYDVAWAAVWSVIAAGCGANAHAALNAYAKSVRH